MANEGEREIAYLDDDGEGHPDEIDHLQGTKWFYRGTPTFAQVLLDDDIARAGVGNLGSNHQCWLNQGDVIEVLAVDAEKGLLKVNITDSLGTLRKYDISSKNPQAASGVWVSNQEIRHPSKKDRDPRTSWQRDDRNGGPLEKARAAKVFSRTTTVRSTDRGNRFQQLFQKALKGMQSED